MDYKITKKSGSKKSGCLVALLIVLIIAAALVGLTFFNLRNIAGNSQIPALLNASYDTEFVQSGPLELKLENISGTVRSNRSITLYWKTDGTVQSLNCAVGDEVKKDQILAMLDPNSLNAETINAEIDLRNAQDELKKLQNTDQKISDALSEMVKAQKELEDAQIAYDSLDPTRASEDQIKIAYENYLKTQNDYDSARARFEATKDFSLDDPTRIKRLGDVGGYRSVRDNALGAYYQLLGIGNELEVMLRDARLRVAQADFEDKQFLYQEAMKGPTLAQLAAANAKIEAAQDKIDASKLIAPFDGTVTQLDTKVNDVISRETAETAAIRLDDLSTLFVDFSVSELNVNDIKIGQKVSLSFTALPDKTYQGIISEIAKSGEAKNDSVTFSVTARIDQPDANIKPGMTAYVSMEIAKIEDTLSVPVSAVYQREGKYYVNIKQPDGSFSRMSIEPGMVSGLRVQVVGNSLDTSMEIQSNVDQVLDNEPVNPMMMRF